MSTIHEQTDIDASPSVVWQVLADVSLLPQLSSSTTEVVVEGVLHEPGQTFDQTVRRAGRSWTSTWTVDEIDVGTCLQISGSLPGGAPCRMLEQLEPLDDGGTRLRIEAEYELPMGLLGRLAGRLGIERQARLELQQVVTGIDRVSRDETARPGGGS